MAEFASKGVAGTGLGLGIAGTALGLLGGGINGLLGVNPANVYGAYNCGCSENQLVNRFELEQESRIAKLESDIALRDANTYNDQKLLEVYKYFDGQIKDLKENQNAINLNQAVFNGTTTSTIGCMQGAIAQLQSLTKLVVPNSSVCPGWGDVTITPATTTTPTA